MVTSSHNPRKTLRREAVAGILLLAAALWMGVWFFRSREDPFRTRLEAGYRHVQAANSQAAEKEWLEAARLSPQNADVYELLGELYLSTEQWDKAQRAFLELKKCRPQTPQLYARLAASTLRTGDEKGALRYAQEELKHTPDDITALGIAMLVYGYQAEDAKRLECLRRLVQQQPDDRDFLTMLAEALTGHHAYAEARPYLDHLIQIDLKSSEAYSLRGLGVLEQDRSPTGLAKAEADFVQALKINPLGPFPRLHLGKVYRLRGDLKPALFQMEQAQKMMPDKMDIYFELAQVYALTKQPAKADAARAKFRELREEADHETVLGKQCAFAPDDFALQLEMGQLMLKKNDLRRASHYVAKALQLRPNDPQAVAAGRQLQAQSAGMTLDSGLAARFTKSAQIAPK